MNNQVEEHEQVDFDSKCPVIVRLNYNAYSKLRGYINNVENEVGGLGSVFIKGQSLIVKDIFLIEQEVSGASTNLSADGLAKFYQERLKANKKDDMGSYKLWWHSHYNFNTFWSKTDDDTIDGFDQETKEDNWFLSIVGNQEGELLTRLDVFRPFRFTYNDVPMFNDILDPKVEVDLLSEIEKKVKDKVVPVQVATHGNGLYDSRGKYIGFNRKKKRHKKKRKNDEQTGISDAEVLRNAQLDARLYPRKGGGWEH